MESVVQNIEKYFFINRSKNFVMNFSTILIIELLKIAAPYCTGSLVYVLREKLFVLGDTGKQINRGNLKTALDTVKVVVVKLKHVLQT